MKLTNHVRNYAFILTIAVNSVVLSSQADGLLSKGDEGLLAAPAADFYRELVRIKPASSEFTFVPDSSSIATDGEDLRFALQNAGKASNDVERITADYLLVRHQIEEFDAQMAQARQAAAADSDNTNPSATNSPEFPQITLPTELPDEFADYLTATIAWHHPSPKEKKQARPAWERILSRPQAERRSKSVWAAFMLARSWENQNPRKAAGYYKQTRELARAGFSDSPGLAAASLGYEARIYLDQGDYDRAVELYLDQMATGDSSARMSVVLTMRALFSRGTNSLDSLAKNPRVAQVVTAYIISTRALQFAPVSRWSEDSENSTSNRVAQIVSQWLEAMESVQVKDPAMAEALALAAYQNGRWDSAEYWVTQAGSLPLAQWLKTKLLLRAGKIDEVGALLSKVASRFPFKTVANNSPEELKDHLSMPWGDDAPHQIQAELGVFHLARGQYTLALDEFLRADSWIDAAYVAERVLSADELKGYVDRYAVPGSAATAAVTENGTAIDTRAPEANGYRLRYLLARRLTRELRGDLAREYYPLEWQPQFDQLVQGLRAGWDASLPATEHVDGFLTAGALTRHQGMELLGTEVGPDWHVYAGNSEGELTSSHRTTAAFTLFPATPDELARAAQHHADPEERFHYRYQAAFLAWEAAQLMPNDSQDTAQVLCTAGSWLKARDPQTADIFYKALARRCAATDIGAAAARIHWFPELDDDGNLVIPKPEQPEPETPTAPPEETGADSTGVPPNN